MSLASFSPHAARTSTPRVQQGGRGGDPPRSSSSLFSSPSTESAPPLFPSSSNKYDDDGVLRKDERRRSFTVLNTNSSSLPSSPASPASAPPYPSYTSYTLPGQYHMYNDGNPLHPQQQQQHQRLSLSPTITNRKDGGSPTNLHQYYVSSSGRPLSGPPTPRAISSSSSNNNDNNNNYYYYNEYPSSAPSSRQHWYVLPVLWLEFLALALTRAVIPSMLLQQYGNRVYLVLGLADCIRGLLAFVACPLFGKLSDQLGRKICLFITVLGTCAPVCSLALFEWKTPQMNNNNNNNNNMTTATTTTTTTMTDTTTTIPEFELPSMAIPTFVILLSLSGIFSSTFTLVFAYISDTIPNRQERVNAYGMALATFGLSFTIGPMVGGYLAKTHTPYVFWTSLCLTIVDILYIWFILPESKTPEANIVNVVVVGGGGGVRPFSSSSSSYNSTTNGSVSSLAIIQQQLSNWRPWDALRVVVQDPFLNIVGQVAFFYYTGLWAVISTLSLYAVQHFHLTPERLGELMSALGLCTMIAEAVLVRIIVPWVGEVQATRIGLLSFAGQCLVLGAAYESWHLFVCVAFSLLGNLVYPSLSSLVSSTVAPDRVGESLGALNGVKALTEGIGPLVFGALMTVSEGSHFPGWPYWIAALLVLVAYDIADKKLPEDSTKHEEDEYIHELEFKQRRRRRRPRNTWNNIGRTTNKARMNEAGDDNDDNDNDDDNARSCWPAARTSVPTKDDEDEEYQDLLPLSEVEESEEEQIHSADYDYEEPASKPMEHDNWAFATPTKSQIGPDQV